MSNYTVAMEIRGFKRKIIIKCNLINLHVLYEPRILGSLQVQELDSRVPSPTYVNHRTPTTTLA